MDVLLRAGGVVSGTVGGAQEGAQSMGVLRGSGVL